MFNHCREFRWSPKGPVRKFHSPHLQAGVPGIFSDLLRSVQLLNREWGAERNGKLPHLFIPSKTAALVPELAVEDLPPAELQPRSLRLQWKTFHWAEHSDNEPSHDHWSSQKPSWNWCLTPTANFGEVRRAQLENSTLLTSTLGPVGSFQIFWGLFRC